MMKFPLSLGSAVLAGWLGASSAAAQTPTLEKLPLPPGPLLERTPDFSKWTITVIDKGAAPPTAASNAAGTPTPAKPDQTTGSKTVVTITKTLPIILIISEGKSDNSTMWCVGSFQVHQDAEYKTPTLFSAASHVNVYVDYSKTDFPELQWISDKNYVGVQKTKDHQYLVFRDNVSNRSPETVKQVREIAAELKIPLDESLFFDARETYIDADTKMPLFWRKGLEYHLYKFVDPPTAPLTLPTDIASMISREQKRLKDLARRPPPG